MKYILVLVGVAVVLAGVNLYLTEDEAPFNQQATGNQNRNQTPERTQQLDNYTVDQADLVAAGPLIADIAQAAELSTTEAEGLQFMREEEKLARDVYQALYDKWGAQVFANIAESEQTHMDAVLTLLERYNLTDPSQADYGTFTNPNLQTLYNNLILQGNESVEAAYEVGALIEDLDINDLQNFIESTEHDDIILVYENLERGSRNHLRAFNRQLERATGETYKPQYISQTAFEEIISGDVERGPQGGRGRGYQNR